MFAHRDSDMQYPTSRLEFIESWFYRNQDGEFSILPSTVASTFLGDFTDAKTMVYTTKVRCLERVKWDADINYPIATVGRPGLPRKEDLTLMQSSKGTRLFLGDADPVDLYVFAWLREYLPIDWLGVSDDFLNAHGTLDIPWIQTPMSRSELDAHDHLPKICPDYCTLLGSFCCSLLDKGFKIEVEGGIFDSDIESHVRS